MEYLVETGELFLDPGIISYTNNSLKPENDNYDNNACIVSSAAVDVDNNTTIPHPSSSYIPEEEESSTTTKNNDNNDNDTSWSVWLSSMTSSLSNLPESLEKKYTERQEYKRQNSSGISSNQQQQNTVLAKRVTKQCRNGDLFTGLVDAITGEPLHGRRVYVSTGEIYEGPFHNNKRHGYGGMNTKSDGGKFIGRFAYDKPINGTYITSDFTYTGSLLEGAAFHGEGGCLAEKNGNIYKGDFVYGVFHGCGSQCNNEFQYNGEFSKGERHGVGSCSINLPLISCINNNMESNNHEESSPYFEEVNCTYKYIGTWVHGVKEGKGSEALILTKRNDDNNNNIVSLTSTYVGNFQQNKRNGFGQLTLFDGTIIEGIWNNDAPILNISIQKQSHQQDLLDDHDVKIDDNINKRTKSAKWRIIFNNGNVYDGEIISNTSNYTNNNDVKQQQHDNKNEESELKSKSFLYRWNKSEPVILPDGIGTMCYSQTGDCYNGNFIMGKRHGHGICIYQKTGNVYNGLWYNDKPAHAECILFPLYHPSVYDMDASDILDFNEIVNEEQKEEDYSSSSISSSKLISSIQLILSILDKGMIEEQEIEEEQHQEYDLLDIDNTLNYNDDIKSTTTTTAAWHYYNDISNNNQTENNSNLMFATTDNSISNNNTNNTKLIKRLDLDDGESTPPTISSSISTSSLSSPATYSCDDVTLLNDEENDNDNDIDNLVNDLVNNDDDLINNNISLLNITDDNDNDKNSNNNNDNNCCSIDNDVHHVRGMIHHDEKNAIFTMYTCMKE